MQQVAVYGYFHLITEVALAYVYSKQERPHFPPTLGPEEIW